MFSPCGKISRKHKGEPIHLLNSIFNNPYLTDDQGPVVQSIVSLTSSLGGQLVKCFMTL